MSDSTAIQAVLERLHNPALPRIELGLSRMRALLARLGHPETRLPPVIHVAGTNGKGSVIAYLESIFAQGGFSVHRYISPHLVRFNERIRVRGGDIGDAALLNVLEEVEYAVHGAPATFFEATTAAAFLAFSRSPADILLLETGLGGRLDATNVIEKPLLTCITPIALDHCEFLGESLSQIAAEKAGIIKEGVPCVISVQEAESLAVLEAKAASLNAPLWRHGKEWHLIQENDRYFYQSDNLKTSLNPSLAGIHQYANAATAVACIDALCHPGEGGDPSPLFAQMDKWIPALTGMTKAAWPARLQRLDHHPLRKLLPATTELWLDGGHNPHAARAIAAWAEERGEKLALICGMMARKDAGGFLSALRDAVDILYAVPVPGEDEGLSAEALQQQAAALNMKACACENVEEALRAAAHYRSKGTVLICGSLYLAGWVLSKSA